MGAYDCQLCGKPTDELGPVRLCKKCAKTVASIPEVVGKQEAT